MNTRSINSHAVNPANEAIKLWVIDAPGSGGANHQYVIAYPVKGAPVPQMEEESVRLELPNGEEIIFLSNSTLIHNCKLYTFTQINFQNGPIKEYGVNGFTHEVLLAIVADRLQSFQNGPYATNDNATALTHVQSATLWLHKRTMERNARGVEGTHKI